MRKLIEKLASDRYVPIITGETPRQIQTLLFDIPDSGGVLKVIIFPPTQTGVDTSGVVYKNTIDVCEAVSDKSYSMEMFSIEQDGNVVYIESKKYKEIDEGRPVWNHYRAEHLVRFGLFKQIMDIMYDLWKSGIYIPDRFPSRNFCFDENNDIVMIDYDIVEGSGCFDQEMIRETFFDSEYIQKYKNAFPSDYEIGNKWFKQNLGKEIREYYE